MKLVWYKVNGFLANIAAVLLVCAVTGVIWHNLFPIPHPAVKWSVMLWLASQVALVPFLFTAVKEWYEDMFLPGGDLYGWEKAALPVAACLGGIMIPMGIVKVLIWFSDVPLTWKAMFIVTPTDIAVALAVAKIFGLARGPRKFLLSLAIIDDIIGIALIAIFFGHGSHWWGFLILVATLIFNYAMYRLPRRWESGFTVAYVRRDGSRKQEIRYQMVRVWESILTLSNRIPQRLRWRPVTRYGWYLIPAVLYWVGFYYSGAHAVVASSLIVFFMPHAVRDLGAFVEFAKEDLPDTLNRLEHALKYVVVATVGFFAFTVMAIDVTTVTQETFIIFAGLVIGKPIGVMVFTLAAMRLWNLKFSDGMNYFSLLKVGSLAGCGFTVALFIAQEYAHGDVALEAPLKLGAALTLVGSIVLLKLVDVVELAWGKLFQGDEGVESRLELDQAD